MNARESELLLYNITLANCLTSKNASKALTRDMKGLRLTGPLTNYFKQRLMYKIHFFIINGAPHPSLSNIRLMDKI